MVPNAREDDQNRCLKSSHINTDKSGKHQNSIATENLPQNGNWSYPVLTLQMTILSPDLRRFLDAFPDTSSNSFATSSQLGFDPSGS